MSKWRPTKDGCIYVIPDIHGSIDLLDVILARITPLRKKKDMIVFLGDYIDRGYLGHEVLDRLIELKAKYGDKVICLKGNHEDMMLQGLGFEHSKHQKHMFDMWIKNGGEETVLGYMSRQGEDLSWGAVPRSKIVKIVPKEHVDFMKSLRTHYETEDFIFVHGGCDPEKPLKEQKPSTFVWDRSLIAFAERFKSKGWNFDFWEKIVIAGHNGHKAKEPFVYGKFMMLDTKGIDKIYVVEVNSMECFVAKKNNGKLVKHNLNI